MTAIAKTDAGVPAQENSGAALIEVISRAASDPQVDVEKLERLMSMHERIMDRQAMADYSAAMAGMQTEIPSIAERGKTNNGRYATLEDIVDTVRPIMQKHGFAVSFRIKTIDKGVEITGVLMHRGGHREETSMLLPADTSGNKNAVQAFGSTVSYGKRYVLCSLLNITTRGQDDDGNAAAPVKTVSPAQAAYLRSLLSQCPPVTTDWFAQEFGEPERVPAGKYDKLAAKLKAGIEKQQEADRGDYQAS